jgi:hypothetical protein
VILPESDFSTTPVPERDPAPITELQLTVKLSPELLRTEVVS